MFNFNQALRRAFPATTLAPSAILAVLLSSCGPGTVPPSAGPIAQAKPASGSL